MALHVIVQFVGGPKDGLVLHSNRPDEQFRALEYYNASKQGTMGATIGFQNGPERPLTSDAVTYTNRIVPVRNDVYTVTSTNDNGTYQTITLGFTGVVNS